MVLQPHLSRAHLPRGRSEAPGHAIADVLSPALPELASAVLSAQHDETCRSVSSEVERVSSSGQELLRPHLARGGPQCVRDQGSADPFVNSVASPTAKLPTLESIIRRNCKAVHAFCWSCVSLVGILKTEPAKSERVYPSTVLLASKQQAAECGLHRSRRGSAASRPPYSGWLTALTTNGAFGLEMVIWRVEVPSSWRFLPTTTRVKVSVPEKSGLAK